MAMGYGVPAPKPEPRKRTKARKAREDVVRLVAFVDAVWAREHLKMDGPWHMMGNYAHCQHCECLLSRFGAWEPGRGEVHHLIPRSRCTKAQRYDLNNGVLLCGALLNDCHGKAQRHEIEV